MPDEARFSFDDLEHPIIQAPLAGGPSTPALAAAVSQAGGLGFIAAGYRSAEQVEADIVDVRGRTDRPFGVNVFVPGRPAGDNEAVTRYASTLAGEAERLGVDAGSARYDDDAWEEKLEVVGRHRVPVASFAFGCPPAAAMSALRAQGSVCWVTVTTPAEATHAASEGADGLVVQGVEAGGHRGSFDDAQPGEIGLLALLQLVGAAVSLPLVATGGLATGRGVAAVLAAGARAAQLGSAFLRSPEAGTSAAHREALAGDRPTALTRAFTGRTARGIVNRFMNEHGDAAPAAYPEIHHVTVPLRAAARARGDGEVINLWAGQAYRLGAGDVPAAELVRQLSQEARDALQDAVARMGGRRR
jgi:nitronate monooxygenase